MTFSSLHAHALPLYTRFGLDAWWPLLYLAGDVHTVPGPDGWTVAAASVAEVEAGGAGLDRGGPVRRSPGLGGPAARQPVRAFPARGTGRGGHGRRARGGVRAGHLAIAPGVPAADAVLPWLATLRAPDGRARVCLPGRTPRYARCCAGWRHQDSDLFHGVRSAAARPAAAVPNPGGALSS